jgi:hypothetical protein
MVFQIPEADQVNATLRWYLHEEQQVADEVIDEVLKRKLFKHSSLYGASRSATRTPR